MRVRSQSFALSSLLALLIAAAAAAAPATPPLQLHVDARDAARHLLHVRESVPVKAGSVALAYPKWLPGEHGPTGPLLEVAGFTVSANGKPLAWRRDDVDMYVIRTQAPAGVTQLEVAFDFTLTDDTNGYSSASSATEHLLLLSWNQVVFYPAGAASDAVQIQADLDKPAAWKYATALTTTHVSDDHLDFSPCSLTRLVDSPVLMGRWFRSLALDPKRGPAYSLDLAADGPEALEVPDSVLAVYRRVPEEAQAWFGGWHHGPYHFLVTLSDHTSHFGLEHHESSDDRVPERTFIDGDLRLAEATLLTHELSHSWNGKYRRPAGLATADYGTPMKGELLWVYEGLTQYSGWLLAGRAGTRTVPQQLDELADDAATLENHRGRTWRPLQDTAVEAQLLYESRSGWESYRRGVDFYDEGTLLWLDADVTIRQLTHGAKSFDDFCHLFHGGEGGPELKPYTFDDVVKTLNAVVPNDWATFLHERVDRITPHPPMNGIANGGWTLAFTDTLPDVQKAHEAENENTNEMHSIGITVTKDGLIRDVVPDSPAFKAGVVPGNSLVAVNGRRWSVPVLRDAIRRTRDGVPIELLVSNTDFFHTAKLDYAGGLRYPVLRRNAARSDLVSQILSPHTKP